MSKRVADGQGRVLMYGRFLKYSGIAVGLIAITLLGFWFFSTPRASLNEDTYALTLALYRVCNQRSEAGLREIEQQWQQLNEVAPPDPASNRTFAELLALANSGRWDQATRATRQTLDDQATHTTN